MMSDDGSIVTKEKVEKYLSLTAEARAKATPIAESEEDVARLDSMMRMCDDYQADAKHFLEKEIWFEPLERSITHMLGLMLRLGLA